MARLHRISMPAITPPNVFFMTHVARRFRVATGVSRYFLQAERLDLPISCCQLRMDVATHFCMVIQRHM